METVDFPKGGEANGRRSITENHRNRYAEKTS